MSKKIDDFFKDEDAKDLFNKKPPRPSSPPPGSEHIGNPSLQNQISMDISFLRYLCNEAAIYGNPNINGFYIVLLIDIVRKMEKKGLLSVVWDMKVKEIVFRMDEYKEAMDIMANRDTNFNYNRPYAAGSKEDEYRNKVMRANDVLSSGYIFQTMERFFGPLDQSQPLQYLHVNVFNEYINPSIPYRREKDLEALLVDLFTSQYARFRAIGFANTAPYYPPVNR